MGDLFKRSSYGQDAILVHSRIDWFFQDQRAFAMRIMSKILYIINTVAQTTAVEPNEKKKKWIDMS
jgi:hypothetical protein